MYNTFSYILWNQRLFSITFYTRQIKLISFDHEFACILEELLYLIRYSRLREILVGIRVIGNLSTNLPEGTSNLQWPKRVLFISFFIFYIWDKVFFVLLLSTEELWETEKYHENKLPSAHLSGKDLEGFTQLFPFFFICRVVLELNTQHKDSYILRI